MVGNEVDFPGIRGNHRIMVEARNSTRIRPKRLGFDTAALAMSDAADMQDATSGSGTRFVAAPIDQTQALPMRGFDLYDPRFGFSPE